MPYTHITYDVNDDGYIFCRYVFQTSHNQYIIVTFDHQNVPTEYMYCDGYDNFIHIDNDCASVRKNYGLTGPFCVGHPPPQFVSQNSAVCLYVHHRSAINMNFYVESLPKGTHQMFTTLNNTNKIAIENVFGLSSLIIVCLFIEFLK